MREAHTKMLKLLLPTLVLLALCMAGLGIRVILKKNGTFRHKCASEITENHEDCPLYELHHGNTATQMAKAVTLADEE